MSTVTVKINNSTHRGKHLLGLLLEMAKTGKDIHVENTPNKETEIAINEARQKKGFKVKNVDELFAQLNS